MYQPGSEPTYEGWKRDELRQGIGEGIQFRAYL